jgi:hypothetical protein
MAELTTCVVLTGSATKRSARSQTGCHLTGKAMHRADLVKLTAQGADQSPAPQSSTQRHGRGADSDTQNGTVKSLNKPLMIKLNVIMPIVF